ncbi:MAG: hypothetical protein SPI03_03780 [Campylobacter sputorum]|uniref:hypothetical protein n=2 Tax=Campylobacter sputorum TaxID=206 RepID=UPI0012904853|nr:hypothetical protein [Campylobacter sputorum]MDY6120446.1 hypothetical protein [Campylobacter sputorum]
MFYFIAGFFGCIGLAVAHFFMIKLFPSNVKFTEISFSYNVTYAISDGITPLLEIFCKRKISYAFNIFYVRT